MLHRQFDSFKKKLNSVLGSIGIRLKIRLKRGFHKELAIIYILLTIAFALIACNYYGKAFMTPTENPPKGPITIFAGPMDEQVVRTDVIINIPERVITIEVKFDVSQRSRMDFIWIMLPYQIISCSCNGTFNAGAFTSSIGYIENVNYKNTNLGSSIFNSTLRLNETLPSRLSGAIVGIHVSLKVNNSLVAIDDSARGSKTAIFTFYGDTSGVETSEMLPFKGQGESEIYTHPTITDNKPFSVQIAPPSSYFYSNSQPPPIEYYVKQDSRWIMFSMDFLNGQYAQTLVCNFGNSSGQSNRELNIFLVGVFVTLSITLLLEVVKEAISWQAQKENQEG